MTPRLHLRPRRPQAGAAPARRIHRPRAADARLWAGLGLVLVSMVGGAALLSRSDDTVVVWQASQDLAVGAPAVAVPVRVSLGDAADAYLPASEPLDGLGSSTVVTAVPAGSLIPRDAIATAAPADTRFVTVAVDPLHAPVGLAAGDVVDVWSTPADAVGTAAAVPAQVIADALVAEVSYDDLGIGGQVPVVLQVAAEQAEALVAATRSGVIDLVAVPLASQQRSPLVAALGIDAEGADVADVLPNDVDAALTDSASADTTGITSSGANVAAAADSSGVAKAADGASAGSTNANASTADAAGGRSTSRSATSVRPKASPADSGPSRTTNGDASSSSKEQKAPAKRTESTSSQRSAASAGTTRSARPRPSATPATDDVLVMP